MKSEHRLRNRLFVLCFERNAAFNFDILSASLRGLSILALKNMVSYNAISVLP